MTQEVNSDDPADTPRPGAPALEKGLDLLEALAAEPNGMTQKALAARIGRSVGEIFRMLGALERRGYVTRNPKSGEYSLSLRLFQLATQHPPSRRLQQAALPVMEELAARTGLACHLSMVSGEHFLIVATAESDRPMGWSVKLGAVFPFTVHFVSARVIAAFQNERRRAELAAVMARQSGVPESEVRPRLESTAATGYDLAPSSIVAGLIDMSSPILDHQGQAVAALTLPFLPQRDQNRDPAVALALLRDAAVRISKEVGAATA